MPGKFAALRFADERTARAEQVGSANTLVRTPRGWLADNTDIDGVAGALGSVSGWALVVGSGGTAPAAVVGLAQLGVAGITVVARNPEKAARLVDLAARVGVASRFCAPTKQRSHRTHDSGKGVFTSLVPGVPPRPGQRIVYVDGGFDLFSSGHIAFLQTVSALEEEHGRQRGWFEASAKAQRVKDFGSDYGPAFVIAGVHDDEVINFHKGINYPIMNIFERGLCVVQCAYIHGVIFSAPYIPSKTYLSTLPFLTSTTRTPDAVYHGPTAFMPSAVEANLDAYEDAKALGIFRETPRHRFQEVNSAEIVQRILDNRQQYEERQRKKGEKGVGEAEHRRREMEAEAQGKERERMRMVRQESMREVERQFGA